MANKQSFTPEEWTDVLESTMLAGMAVSAAEPSGLWGALKEAFASSSALATAKLDPGSSELVKAVVAEFETPQGRLPFRMHCESALLALSRLTSSSAHSTICGRSRQSSMLRRLATRPLSRPGCEASAKRSPRLLQKAVSSVSEVCK